MDTINIQLAYFFAEDYNKPIEKLSINIQEAFGHPEKVNYIPIDNSAPSELPRLEIVYKNCKIQSSKNRIDLFVNSVQAYNDCIEMFNSTDLRSLGIVIRRVGFVRTYFMEKAITPSKKLLSNDFETLELKEISLRINIEKEILGSKCNNIEQLDYGEKIDIRDNGREQIRTKGFFIRRDINTLNEIALELVKDDRKSLVDKFFELSEEFTLKKKID